MKVSVGNCGGRIKAKEGIVASPGFPEDYSTENQKVCQWVIDVSENGDTMIDFTMFDLQPDSEDEVAVSSIFTSIKLCSYSTGTQLCYRYIDNFLPQLNATRVDSSHPQTSNIPI